MENSITLDTKRDVLPDDTRSIYQTTDGTIFYLGTVRTSGYRGLYVKHECKEIITNLPTTHIKYIINVSVNDNEVYFEFDRKIYIAVYMESTENINVTCVRQLLYGENCVNESMYRRLPDESLYVYRSFDVPEKERICVHIPPPFHGGAVVGIHRGMALYVISGIWNKPKAYKLCENVLAVEVLGFQQYTPHIFSQDSSPFVYIIATFYNSLLLVLDTDSMNILPPLQIENGCKIAGIHNGKLTMYSDKNMITVQLPNGYFVDDETKNRITENDRKILTYHDVYKSPKVAELEQKLKESTTENEQMKQAISQLENKLAESDAGMNQLKLEKEELTYENEKLQKELCDLDAEPKQNYQDLISEINELKSQVIENKVWALASVRKSLKFEELEKLPKPLIVIQLGDGSQLYFDNAKPFELFSMNDKTKVNADLKLLEGEYDCSFKGTIQNSAYFSTIRGKAIRFFRASINNGEINIDPINEMRTSEFSLFKNQPAYYIEQSREWVIYQYNESYNEKEGEKFDISEINLLSKYERQYHKGILYLFRETGKAKIERSFCTPSDSEFIYIVNQEQNVLLILNTIDLTVSQQCYEPPSGSNNHSIVGIHEGILTMAFDGVWGRHLSTTMLF